jgi:peptidyl-prolyl cis-trans isomerase SurA
MVLAVGGVLAIAGPVMAANPFAPALSVNEGVITHYEIDQRMLLLAALGASGDLRELAIEQLTEDRVKLQAAEAMEVELPEAAATAGLEEFATARGLAVEDVERVLEARGIDRQTMDDFVLAGLAWREVVAVRYRARATPSEADLDAALALAATTPREMLQLAEIALPFGERSEAETLERADRLYRELARGASFEAVAREYSRSATAERGGLLEPMPATQLPPAIRPQVLLLGPGQVTRPVPISGGVAILKLAAIRQEPPADVATDEAAREALRQRLFTERITSFGQGYLQELLSDALIIER